MADTAMSESLSGPVPDTGGGAPDVRRLRARGCWTEAAALLAPHGADRADVALLRAMLLIESCMFTLDGWAGAEDALRVAEALAATDEERGAAASERGYLAYSATLFSVRDRADEARAAFGRSAALLAPTSSGRPLLDFRRGLVSQNLAGNPVAARAAYRRAHAGAVAHGDALLMSYTWGHLAGLAADDGDVAEARHGFAESLRIRVELGFMVGTPPALLALAEFEPEPEATALRTEATRLYTLLGGIPAWMPTQEAPGGAAADGG